MSYSGVHGAARSWVIGDLTLKHSLILAITKDRAQAEELTTDLRFFQRELPVLHFGAWDTLPFEAVSPQDDVAASRLACLNTLLTAHPCVVVASADAVIQRVPPRQIFDLLSFQLQRNSDYKREELIKKLNWLGYREVPLVEEPAELGIRGEVIDLFPAGMENPVRLEFHGTTLANIRTFDPDSQRSIGELESLHLFPVRELIPFHSPFFSEFLKESTERVKARARDLECPPSEIEKALVALRDGTHLPGIELVHSIALDSFETIFDYLPSHAMVVLEEEIAIRHSLDRFRQLVNERAERLVAEHQLFPEPEKLFISDEDLTSHVSRYDTCSINALEITEGLHSSAKRVNLHTNSHIELMTRLKTRVGTGQALKPLRAQLDKWRSQNFNIAFVVGAQARAKRLQRALLEIAIDAAIVEVSGLGWSSSMRRTPVAILEGHLSSGFTLNEEKIIFISETELFPEKSYRKQASGKTALKRILNSLSQLQVDDYIVHTEYGIGLYKGLKHLEIEGVQGDFLQIEYADSRLFLPIHNISRVQKFFAAEGQKPVVDKLGGSRWLKSKLKVKQAVAELAGDLIKLYAARSIVKGWRFEPAGAEDERFADGFAFNETPDQQRTIEEVLKDMAAERPMDRLVCGDVGFGKTEVALRAAYKCTQHARQVAVLVPTTILVEQHRATFSQRFADYPVKVAALSRFYSSVENKKTIAEIADGTVDIVIGTHRLLQKDIAFKDLGLLIIDEEHRFGVQQKERLKQMRKQVDVLSLTATPIPRTLHMSLLDVKDTSVISTPPHDRRAIRTYVAGYSESLIQDSIRRELQRGGQVFYLHNRVQSIDLVALKLSQLVPEARFDFAHGQMSETQLENIMQRFLNKEIDVLVCTTIIESGIDIPNANTILIERADAFGLAQLYQLRGRVGRSSRQAYAYFLVPNFERLSADAEKRLGVLQSLDDLGLGFNLAIRDLEIRGAGNLLGKEQSGNVLTVGFELYTKILKEAVLNLKGDEVPAYEAIDPEMKLGISAFVPQTYVPDVSERLLLYQRLADLQNPDEADDLAQEIEDRFGRLPREVVNLIEVMRFRSLLRMYAVVKAEIKGETLALSFSKQSPLNPVKAAALTRKPTERYKLTKSLNLLVTLESDRPRSEMVFEAGRAALHELCAP